MIPAPSWPPTIGKRGIRSPWRRCSSEWHRPAATQRIRTSPCLGSSSSSSPISQSVPVSRRNAALVFTRLLPSGTWGGDATGPWFPRRSRSAGERGGGLRQARVGALGLAVVGQDRRVPDAVLGPVDELVLQDLAHARVAAGDLVGAAQVARADLLRERATALAEVAELRQVEVEAFAL